MDKNQRKKSIEIDGTDKNNSQHLPISICTAHTIAIDIGCNEAYSYVATIMWLAVHNKIFKERKSKLFHSFINFGIQLRTMTHNLSFGELN
jgi:hypothetical protein